MRYRSSNRLLYPAQRYLEQLSARHVFRSQTIHKYQDQCENLAAIIYFENDGFRLLVIRALGLIARSDPTIFADINENIKGFVEISKGQENVNFGTIGMPIGIWYDQYDADLAYELMEKATACAIVQFAVCCKLLSKVANRSLYLYDKNLRRKIKRMSIIRMHKFMLLADFESRYSFEIECKLKNGTYDC